MNLEKTVTVSRKTDLNGKLSKEGKIHCHLVGRSHVAHRTTEALECLI